MAKNMVRSGINGCCAGSYFYNVGGAHGHPRAKDATEFGMKLLTLGYNRINTVITNYQQKPEEEYLEKNGFKCVYETSPDRGDINLKLWAASSDAIAAGLSEIRAELERKRKEELEKKRAEEAERRRLQQLEQERARKEQEERAKKFSEQVKNTQRFERPITSGDIRTVLMSMPKNTMFTPRPVTIGKYLQDFYNLKTPMKGATAGSTTTAYFWNDDFRNLARSVNRRLRDEGRLD